MAGDRKLTKENIDDHMIAMESDGDYQPTVWAAFAFPDGFAGIVRCSHNSTVGTEEVLEGSGLNWEGRLAELIDMAVREVDPDMPGRLLDDADKGADTNLLRALYKRVIEWRRTRPTPALNLGLALALELRGCIEPAHELLNRLRGFKGRMNEAFRKESHEALVRLNLVLDRLPKG